nr:tetratricopeptide repeat protein [Calditrichia bacterium]
MADIGLNQNFSTDSRDFHIQTATLVDEGLIRAEVFEKGRLLFVENYQYERRNFNQDVGPDSRLRKIVDQVHQSMIEEIDSLFEISEQIFGEKNATAHEKIGLVFLYMHVFDKAESHLQASIEINKNYYGSYIHLARAYFLQKRYNKAYELLSEITGKNFHYPDMYNLLGMINLEKKKHSQAFQYFKQALKYNNAYIEAYFNLIEAILQRMVSLKGEKKEQEIKKRISFLKILLKKIDNFGNAEDRKQSSLLNRVLNKLAIKKALKLVHDYRETNYIRHMPPEIIGY